MAADEVELQQLELVRGDDDGGELAEAGVDAVDGAAFGHDAVHHGPVLGHAGQGALVQRDSLPPGDARQQRCREGTSIETDHRTAFGEIVKASTRARPKVRPAML